MWNLQNPYQYRDDNLRVLGFRSYRQYLSSELWQSIRARAIQRAQGKCERCSRPTEHFQVHHRAYDPATLRGDSVDALTASCPSCHRKAERPNDKTRARADRLAGANRTMLRKPDYFRAWKARFSHVFHEKRISDHGQVMIYASLSALEKWNTQAVRRSANILRG